MVLLFTQVFVFCAGSFLAGVLLTWVSLRPKISRRPEPVLITEIFAESEPPYIKANSRTMIFHTPDSPYYKRMKGDAFFGTVEEAEEAGYAMWRPRVKAAS